MALGFALFVLFFGGGVIGPAGVYALAVFVALAVVVAEGLGFEALAFVVAVAVVEAIVVI